MLLEYAHEPRQHRTDDHPRAKQEQQPQVAGWIAWSTARLTKNGGSRFSSEAARIASTTSATRER